MKTKFKQTEIGMIPEEWEVVKIETILDKIIDYRGKTPKKSTFGIKTLSARSIKNGRIDYNQTYFISEKTFEQWEKRGKPQKGDVLLTTEGPLGEVAQLDRERVAIAQRLLTLRGKDKQLDNSYLKYFLMSPIGQHVLLSKATGTTVQGIKQSEFRKILIAKPSFQEQTNISKILSDLDSKIELNQQMNKKLEAIGQAIFKRWFIDFEFPNEKGKPYKSSGGEMVFNEELGKDIPKGWGVSKIGDEFEIVLGGTPSTTNKSYWENGTIAWINSGEINNFRITEPTAYITEEAVNNSATKLMPKKTTVLAITGATLGQVSRIEIDTCANQSVIGVIENEDISSEYIYLWVKHKIADLISHQTGGAQQHINKNNVNEMRILLIDNSTMAKFNDLIKPIFSNISTRCFESQNLSKIRDSLLPRLMSGKIRVLIAIKT